MAHVVIASTGLTVFGRGKWLAERHDAWGKRTWRTAHLAVDPQSGKTLACELITNVEGDASQVGLLLKRIPGSLGSMIADGAYDGEPVYRVVSACQPDPPVDVVVPPRATAAPNPDASIMPGQRDRHVQLI